MPTPGRLYDAQLPRTSPRRTGTSVFGLVAEFETSEATVEAARRAYAEGYREMEAYSPMPVDGLVRSHGLHQEPSVAAGT